MLMLALRLILADKGRKQHCLPFIGSSLGLRYFWKRGNIRKELIEIESWGSSVYFLFGFQENYMKILSAF